MKPRSLLLGHDLPDFYYRTTKLNAWRTARFHYMAPENQLYYREGPYTKRNYDRQLTFTEFKRGLDQVWNYMVEVIQWKFCILFLCNKTDKSSWICSQKGKQGKTLNRKDSFDVVEVTFCSPSVATTFNFTVGCSSIDEVETRWTLFSWYMYIIYLWYILRS